MLLRDGHVSALFSLNTVYLQKLLVVVLMVSTHMKSIFFFLWPLDKETGDRLSKIVDEACLLLADYNGRLAAELEDRITISKMLAAFIKLQKDKLAESEKKLEVSNG